MSGRDGMPRKIMELVSAPANVAVHGSPGSGKSWMADRAVELLSDRKVVRLDLSTVTSGAEALDLVAAMVRGGAASHLATPNAHEAWREARRAIDAVGSPVVVVLDQFDRVLTFPDAEPFLLLFRELVHRPESLRCTALIASRRSLQMIEAKVRGISTLASVFYTEYLGALEAEDIASLAAPAAVHEDEVERCLSWSGGHPSLAKYWLATRPQDGDAASDLVRAKLVLRVLDHLADLSLIDATAQLVLGPVVGDLLFERNELELLGVLRGRDPQLGAHALSDTAVFRNALRSRTWDMNPWGVLGLAEVRLRGVVETRLLDSYGGGWPELIAKRNPAVARARAEALEKQGRDVRMFGREAPWLSYTYPGDLWNIIQVEWDLFKVVFASHDKPYWRGVLVGLSEYRAPLAHGRPEVLSEGRRMQCRVFAEEVIAAIDGYEGRLLSGSPVDRGEQEGA